MRAGRESSERSSWSLCVCELRNNHTWSEHIKAALRVANEFALNLKLDLYYYNYKHDLQ